MGSLALSLCHLAAGRVDAVCSLKAARARSTSPPAQLLVRERGLAIELFDVAAVRRGPARPRARSRIAAAGTAELCKRLGEALSA